MDNKRKHSILSAMPKVFIYDAVKAAQALTMLSGMSSPWAQKRYKVYNILAFNKDLTLGEIARQACVNRKTVRKFVALLDHQTTNMVAVYNRRGRHIFLTTDQEVELRQDFANLEEAVEVQKWLTDKGVLMSIKKVYSLLRSLNLSLRETKCSKNVLKHPSLVDRQRLTLSANEVELIKERLKSEVNQLFRARLKAILRVGTSTDKVSSIALEIESLGTSYLSVRQITDIQPIIKRILAKSDPVADHLNKKLLRNEIADLKRLSQSNIHRPDSVKDPAVQLILQLLKNLIRDRAFFNKSLFSPRSLRAETLFLLDHNPPDHNFVRLHRMLLEDAFAKAIKRSHVSRQTISRWCHIYRSGRQSGIEGGVKLLCC